MGRASAVATPLATRIPEPLRLPRGSVRGTIPLLVTAAYAYLLLQDKPVPSVLVNSVVVVIAFYFGSRAAAGPPVPPAPGQPPTFVVPAPRRTKVVRGLLLIGFAGLAAWFFRTNRPSFGIPAELVAVLEVLGGYASGMTVSWLRPRRAHENMIRKRFATIARDLIAAGGLGHAAYNYFRLSNPQA